ncbi:hypothetical protein ACPEEZ_12215 [Frigoribacterium sp. 2-23]|uniref:hypothetical protein n=1 Tax=Frigoribacterium sp. 2-23 TaxID=3415006 RepID=UPI003C6EC360
MFRTSVANHRAALDAYEAALVSADGDVTGAAVQEAATVLHETLTSLPVAHTVYAGTGFPAARYSEADARRASTPRTRGEASLGVHPDMLVAIQGDPWQRGDLAGDEDLPLAIEIALAVDPDPQVRSSLVLSAPRSRTVILLMEQREDDPGVRELLARQPYASPEYKLPLVAADLTGSELAGLFELLELDEATVKAAYRRWNRIQNRRERLTVAELLSEIS